VLLVTKCDEQTVRDELDVLAHELAVHANERARERLREELLLDCDGLGDDHEDSVRVRAPAEVREEQAGEVRVHALVARDELVGESETRHEAALLEPKDAGERAGEEDALDGCERDETLAEGRLLVVDPAQRPVGLALDARDSLDGVEEIITLGGIFDVGVDEQRVGLGVNVLPVLWRAELGQPQDSETSRQQRTS